MNLIKLYKSACISIVAFSAVINLLMLAPTWYMLQVYDRVLTSRDENTLLGLSLIVVFIYFIYSLLERFRSLILSEIAERIDQNLSPTIRLAILNSTVADRSSNVNLFNDLNVVKQFITGVQLVALLDTPWVIIYLFVIYMLSIDLGNIALLSALVLLATAVINQKMSHLSHIEIAKANLAERQLISTALSASESVKAMGMQHTLAIRMQGVRDFYLSALNGANLRGIEFSSLTKFFRVLIQSGILGYGAYLSINNEISGGMIIAGSILLGRMLSPIESVINSWKQISEFKRSLTSIQFIQNEQDRAVLYSVSLGRPDGGIELKDVNLKLKQDARPALEDISLRIPAGKSLAIIGPSGAGKTSLLKVMAGIHKVTSGFVLIDGADLSQMNRSELGAYVGYLGQTTDLLAGKISENIARFGKIESDSIIDAANKCGAHEMILSLPQGYETEIGDQGHGLSEGQRRKIGLARAVYKTPAMLFLDEPDTSLDETSLNQLSQLIQTLKASRVTFAMTTHKLNLAMQADFTLLLIEGQIKLFGPSREVLDKIRSP